MKLKYVQWIGLVAIAFASIAAAQPGPGWGEPGYGPPPGYPEPPGTRDPREGKVQVQTFAASTPAVAALGHGPITINSSRDGPNVGMFEAAIADQLGHAGYQVGAPGAGQALEFNVTRQIIQPPERGIVPSAAASMSGSAEADGTMVMVPAWGSGLGSISRSRSAR